MESQKYAPIAFFVYNRPDHARKTIEALLANKEANETDLFVFSDAPKNENATNGVIETREYVHSITGFKNIEIIEHRKNYGLANSLIDGITTIINKYGKVIVVEDDIVTSPYFLQYMNEALELYKDEERIASIHGYLFPIREQLPETFFTKWQGCWGWATWKRAWDKFNPDAQKLYNDIKRYYLMNEFNISGCYDYMDMLRSQIDGTIDSWAIRWDASVFLNDMLILNPGRSLVFNSGFDGSGGTHNIAETHFLDTKLADKPIKVERIPIRESLEGRKIFVEFYRNQFNKQGLLKRILKMLGLLRYATKVKKLLKNI